MSRIPSYKPYLYTLGIALLLVVGCLVSLSLLSKEVSASCVTGTPEVIASLPEQPADELTSESKEPLKKILVFGDSMSGWMGERLGAYGQLNDFEVATIIWDGSTISKWAHSEEALEKYLEEIDPDGVVICLGMNSLFERNPSARLTEPTEKILKVIGDRQILWVGPPSWPGKGDGEVFNNWLEHELGNSHYYNSSHLTLPRQSKTNPHPTRIGTEEWVDSIVKWIPGHADFNLRLDEIPAPGKFTRGDTFIYKRMKQNI